MDFSNPSKTAGSIVDSLKDKLSFGSSRNAEQDEYIEDAFDDYGEYGYDEGFDDYEDYGEYGFDESYAPNGYSDSYNGGYSSRSPRLVSSDDIRKATPPYVPPSQRSSEAAVPTNSSVPGYLSSSAPKNFTTRTTNRITETADLDTSNADTIGFDRPDTTYRDFVSPYQRSSAEKTGTMASTGSAGLDGLFTPTDASSQVGSLNENGQTLGGLFSRKVEIFEPKDFEQAADIVPMLKEGSVVILNLKFVNAGLSKRILDFSFGVVAALEATITYEAPQVFSITQNGKLTLVERDQLRASKIL
jgi:cell division inhibitor SepF